MILHEGRLLIMSNKFEIKFVTPADGFRLRSDILRPSGMAPYKGIEGENLETSFHVGAYFDDNIISVVSFIKNSSDLFDELSQYNMRAMVTDPNYRGQHAGSQVIEFGINELIKRNVKLLWFNAREYAIEFYEKNGFTTIGEKFMIPDICMHKVMYKYL